MRRPWAPVDALAREAEESPLRAEEDHHDLCDTVSELPSTRNLQQHPNEPPGSPVHGWRPELSVVPVHHFLLYHRAVSASPDPVLLLVLQELEELRDQVAR